MNSNFISIILLVASAGLFFAVINPQYMDFKANRTEVVVRDEALKNATSLRKIRDGLQDRMRNITEEQETELQKLLPDTVDTIRLINDITTVAKRHDIQIKKVNIDKDPNAQSESGGGVIGPSQSAYGILGLSFSFSATYDTFADFIDDIERSLRIIDITSANVAASKDSVKYDFSVLAQTYWLK